MKYPIYAIRDVHVGFGQITVSENDAVAMRQFHNAIDIDNSLFQTAPSDFSLFRIGEYDTDTGFIEPIAPTIICLASDFIRSE